MGEVILGIDPGTRVTGYGIVRHQKGIFEPLDWGCIRPPPNLPLEDRYLILHQGVLQLVDKYTPKFLSVETQFFQKNAQSALKVGMARGVIIVAARLRGVEICEYSPTKAKKAIVGNGKATKSQVQRMIQQLLGLKVLPSPEDASDALALALCHAHTLRKNLNEKKYWCAKKMSAPLKIGSLTADKKENAGNKR